MQAFTKIHKLDNVAVALTPLSKLAEIDGLIIAEDVPAGHKVALTDIGKGERIIKYGGPIGEAPADIHAGSHVHTANVRTLLAEETAYYYKGAPVQEAPCGAPLAAPLIDAYRRKDGQIGIRNEVWVIPTVGCVNHTAEALAHWADRELAGLGGAGGGTIDGVYAWTHPYGCSQMGDDHANTRTILADLVHHPNAGAVLVLALGCENNTLADFKKALGDEVCANENIAFLTAQDETDEISSGKKLLEQLAARSATAVREKVSASRLVVGFKCGGSDGFSGITANPLVGRFCDAFTAMG